jgi:drug/metabolite transporter (DMT)-like permease
MSRSSGGLRVPLLFAALGVIWGVPYLMIKVAVAELEPSTLVFARTAVAAAVMLPIALSRSTIRPVLRRWRPVLLYAAVEIVVPWFLLARAEVHLSSSFTGLLLAGVPVAGVVIALVLRTGEQLTSRTGAGIAVGLVGVALLVGVDLGVLGGGDRAQLLAVVELAGVVVCYAIGPVVMVRAMPDLPASGVIAVSLVAAALATAVPGLVQAPSSWPSAPVVLSVLGLALVCTALAFLLLFALVAEVGAVRATLITYLNPAVAVVAGVLVLDERLTWATVAGFGLVVGGSVLASRRRPVPPPDAACVADASVEPADQPPAVSAGELGDR